MRAEPNHREVAQQTEMPTRTAAPKPLDENLMDQQANEAKRVLLRSLIVRKAAKPTHMPHDRPAMPQSRSAEAHVPNPRGDKWTQEVNRIGHSTRRATRKSVFFRIQIYSAIQFGQRYRYPYSLQLQQLTLLRCFGQQPAAFSPRSYSSVESDRTSTRTVGFNTVFGTSGSSCNSPQTMDASG